MSPGRGLTRKANRSIPHGRGATPTRTCSGRSSTPKNTSTTTDHLMRQKRLIRFVAGMIGFWLGTAALAQEVCLPAPRLLTIMPMGGRAGTSFEVTITGENIDGANELLFSDPR